MLLHRLNSGDRDAYNELFPLVYDDLCRIARRQRRSRGGPPPTLNTTALVHEAYLRFAGHVDAAQFEHRGSFFALAAVAMRHVLIDRARRHLRAKRGGGVRPLDLSCTEVSVESQAERLVALDQGLERLEQVSARLRRVVELRFFGGLTEEETASVLGVTTRTVRRDWVKAKAWLAVELGW